MEGPRVLHEDGAARTAELKAGDPATELRREVWISRQMPPQFEASTWRMRQHKQTLDLGQAVAASLTATASNELPQVQRRNRKGHSGRGH